MRKVILFLIISVVFANAESTKLKIAIIDFRSNKIDLSEVIGISNNFRDEIIKSGKFVVLERERMEEILKEQGFQQTGCTNTECAIQVGNLLNVQAIVLGELNIVGNTYIMSVRIVNVSTGEIIVSSSEKCEDCTLNEVLKLTVPICVSEITKESNEKASYFNMARQYFDQHKYSKALQAYTLSIEKDEGINHAYLMRGAINYYFIPNPDTAAALKDLSYFLRMEYNDKEAICNAHYLRGRIYENMNFVGKAYLDYKKVRDECPVRTDSSAIYHIKLVIGLIEMVNKIPQFKAHMKTSKGYNFDY